jgi:hypothetical protein
MIAIDVNTLNLRRTKMKALNNIRSASFCLAMLAASIGHAQMATTSVTTAETIDATYQNGVLTIPLVDSAELVGFVQDAKLHQTAQGDWRLVEYKAVAQPLNSSHLSLALVETVELVKTDSFPVQVFLKLKGVVNGCDGAGQAPQRRKDNLFELAMYAVGPAHPELVLCPAALFPFTKVVPLDVYGLPAGNYQYALKASAFADNSDARVTKVFGGSFVLSKDNAL